jgi:hypothetical protein
MALSSLIVMFVLYRLACLCPPARLLALLSLPAACCIHAAMHVLCCSPADCRVFHKTAALAPKHQPAVCHSPCHACLHSLCRKVPHKGKLLAGSAIFGSSFLAAVRWLFGVWLPSLHQVGAAPDASWWAAACHVALAPCRCVHAWPPGDSAQGHAPPSSTACMLHPR